MLWRASAASMQDQHLQMELYKQSRNTGSTHYAHRPGEELGKGSPGCRRGNAALVTDFGTGWLRFPICAETVSFGGKR